MGIGASRSWAACLSESLGGWDVSATMSEKDKEISLDIAFLLPWYGVTLVPISTCLSTDTNVVYY